MVEGSEISLKDTLKSIENRLQELTDKHQIQPASFWSSLKFWNNVSKRQMKKNWIQIIHLSDNKVMRIMKAQIDENIIMIDNIPHKVDASDVFLHKGKPTIIQPSWSIKPLSPTQNLQETKEAGNSTLGWEYIMNYLKKTEIKSIKNMGTMVWVIGGIVVIGGIYYLIKSGAFS